MLSTLYNRRFKVEKKLKHMLPEIFDTLFVFPAFFDFSVEKSAPSKCKIMKILFTVIQAWSSFKPDHTSFLIIIDYLQSFTVKMHNYQKLTKFL